MVVCIECYSDETFLKVLGFEGEKLLHQKGKGEVLKAIEKSEGRAGMVDEDPQSLPPKQWFEYVAVKKRSWFQCLHHREKKERRLVVLCPYLEEALYAAASSVSVLPSTFGLPQTAKELHAWERYDKSEGYRHFLKTIVEKNRDFSIIREWLFG